VIRSLLLLSAFVCSCAKPVPLHPNAVAVEGAFHAIACGPVTAVFSGNPDALQQLGPDAPRSYAVESLAFRFPDGVQRGFAPKGQLFFSDWSFELFSPDCSKVALQVDHYGPIHVVAREQLQAYLEGKSKPTVIDAPHATEAMVVGQLTWVSNEALEFVASAGGQAQALRATGATLEPRFPLTAAPHGLRRTPRGYELAP
jgi:hypothetical protein